MIISPFSLHNLIRILIPIRNCPSFLIRASVLPLLFLSLIFVFISLCGFVCKYPTQAMKVHPLPKKQNNIAIRYQNNITANPSSVGSNKNLRRLPHIFSRILELPFRSDADVSIEESDDCFRFVAETEDIGRDVRAQAIEIHPGVTKVVVRPNGYVEFSLVDDLELDMWRFRLPNTTRPELASAEWADGELIVTVPKGEEDGDGEEAEEVWGDGGDGAYRGGMGNSRLVLVQ
ncbi:uncharacterized protein LOC120014543 [Tripterygium wilfordii]|uniref:uncharacterized protein LOC120014543 n=1 Tax=Tripterygium wilfordii TaxID=458696 RepID=UPI0018F7EC61|nr:uncharacterized protein LOC120014543 [Tripterygium wilfordii]